MMKIALIGLLAYLAVCVSGCNGCGPSATGVGSSCQQTSDCADGLWCLGGLCQKIPEQGGDSDLSDNGGECHGKGCDGGTHKDAGGNDGGVDAAVDAGHDTGVDVGPLCQHE